MTEKESLLKNVLRDLGLNRRARAACGELMAETRSEPCLLCKGRPDRVCLFIPGNDFIRKIPLPVPEGRAAVIAYTLCDKCNEIQDDLKFSRVEIKLLMDLLDPTQGDKVVLGEDE